METTVTSPKFCDRLCAVLHWPSQHVIPSLVYPRSLLYPLLLLPSFIARLSGGLYSINSDCAQVTYSVVAPALTVSFRPLL